MLGGATHWDGAALAFLRDDAKPFRHDWIAYYDLIGSQVGSDSVVVIPRSFATIESSGLDVVPVNIEPVYFRRKKLFPMPPRTRSPVFCSREVVIKS